MPFDLEENEKSIIEAVRCMHHVQNDFKMLCSQRDERVSVANNIKREMLDKLGKIKSSYGAIASLWKDRLECLEADYRNYQLYAAGSGGDCKARDEAIGDSLDIYQQIQEGKVSYAKAIARYRATEGMIGLLSVASVGGRTSYFWSCKISDRKI